MKTKIFDFLYQSFIIFLMTSLIVLPMEFFVNVPIWLSSFGHFSCTFWIGIASIIVFVFSFEMGILIFNVLKHFWLFIKHYKKS